MPEVSIIVPNYNHARFLEERLESIFSQTFQDFEVILLDDCSTDNSIEILQKYAGRPKVKGLYINESNSGSPFKQWFKGISLAGGKYIWIAESDDVADEDFLAALVPALEANSRLALAYCQSKIIDENSDVTGEYSNYSCACPERWERDFTNSGTDEISSFLLRINTIPNASATLIRKSMLDHIMPPDNQNTMGDWYIWIKILSRGDLFYTAKPLNCFRQSSQSTRQDCPFEGKQARIFQAIELMEQLAQEKILNPENYRKAMLCRLDSWAFECFAAQVPLNNLFYVLKQFPALKKYAPQLLLYYVRHKLHLRSRFRLKKYAV